MDTKAPASSPVFWRGTSVGIRGCARRLSSRCGEQGLLLIVESSLLIAVASYDGALPVMELQVHRLSRCSSGSRVWLSSCDTQVWLLPGLWDPPEPGSNQRSLHEQVGSQPLDHKASPIFCTSVPHSNILLSSERP